MIYDLLQHSHWNRVFHPFLRCGCIRGDCEKNGSEHECHMWSDAEELDYYNKSRKKWEDETENNPLYNSTKHKDWCNKSNMGITHFGISPTLLPRSRIVFDSFHMNKANGVLLLEATIKLVKSYGGRVIVAFNDLIEYDLQWGGYLCDKI